MSSTKLLNTFSSQMCIFIDVFNIIWFNDIQRVALYSLFVNDNNYRQLVTCSTTDSKTCIDQIYTNLSEKQIKEHMLETYFTDHKCSCALINNFQ